MPVWGGKKRRLGGTTQLAEAELGVVKLTADKVGAGVGGMRAVGRGVGSEEGSSKGKRGSRKGSKVSVTRVAPVLGMKT